MSYEIKIKGNYDEEAGKLLAYTRAEAVVLIVLGGMKGDGFSVAGLDRSPADGIIPQLPGILRNMADQIELDLKLRANS
jgi:hypothetical protein